MNTREQPKAEQPAGIAKPQTEKLQAPSQPKLSKTSLDPFWLHELFPDPVEVFAFKSPPLSELVRDCVFCLDANVLLAPFEVSKRSLASIDTIYSDLAGERRLFVPGHAVREYAKNRATKIVHAYEDIERRISQIPTLSDLHSPMLEGFQELAALAAVLKSLREKSNEAKDKLAALKQRLTEWGWSDPVSDLYRRVFDARNIMEISTCPKDLEEMLEERYSKRRPPGYKDIGKDDGGSGDLIIWLTLMSTAKSIGKSLVFVCNDSKGDWYHRAQGGTVMPRTELCHEFFRETGQHFTMMSWPRFLELMHAPKQAVEEAQATRITQSPLDRRPTKEPLGHKYRGLSAVVKTVINANKDYQLMWLLQLTREGLIQKLLAEIVTASDRWLARRASTSRGVAEVQMASFVVMQMAGVIARLETMKGFNEENTALLRQLLDLFYQYDTIHRDLEQIFFPSLPLR